MTGTHGLDPQFGRFLHDPLETVKLDQRSEQSETNRRGLGFDPFEHAERDGALLEAIDLGEVHALVVGDLELLPGFRPENPAQVVRRLTRQLGAAASHRRHKEPPPGHVE